MSALSQAEILEDLCPAEFRSDNPAAVASSLDEARQALQELNGQIKFLNPDVAARRVVSRIKSDEHTLNIDKAIHAVLMRDQRTEHPSVLIDRIIRRAALQAE